MVHSVPLQRCLVGVDEFALAARFASSCADGINALQEGRVLLSVAQRFPNCCPCKGLLNTGLVPLVE